MPSSIAALTLNMLETGGWTIVAVEHIQRYATLNNHAILCYITANHK